MGFVLLHIFVIYCYPLQVCLFSNERCEGGGYEQEGRCWNWEEQRVGKP